MATLDLISVTIDAAGVADKKVSGSSELYDSIFNAPVKPQYFYEVVKSIQAQKRAGNASTKTRGLIRGGGRKPYRQKGTGRARFGSRRNPLWRGGGIIFGPRPRDWGYSVNKTLRRNALRAAITARRMEHSLVIVEKFDLPEIKTRYMKAILDELEVSNALVVDAAPDQKLARSARNIPFIKVISAKRLNVYDILLHEHLIITKAALEEIEKVLEK